MNNELTLTELARMAGYTDAATLRQAARRGTFKAWRRFGLLVSTPAELQCYLNQRTTWKQDNRTIGLSDAEIADEGAIDEALSYREAGDDERDNRCQRANR